jgi:hypothetical protein
MMLINPYMFGATLSTVIDYQFNGADNSTTTTDATGNTTASGLGVQSYSQYAYINTNNLLQARKNVVIDNSGALSPLLSFEGDFEIEIKTKFINPYNFFAENVLNLYGTDSNSISLTIWATGAVTFSYFSSGVDGFTINGTGAAINVYQTFKMKRDNGLISLYVDDVLRGSVYNASVMSAGRLELRGTDGDRYTDYLRIKKA